MEGFAERIERAVESRVAGQAAARYFTDQAHASAGRRQLALGIVSVMMGIPVTALTLVPENGGLTALGVGWGGLVGVNVAHALQSRRR